MRNSDVNGARKVLLVQLGINPANGVHAVTMPQSSPPHPHRGGHPVGVQWQSTTIPATSGQSLISLMRTLQSALHCNDAEVRAAS